jgi:hypothetical protein
MSNKKGYSTIEGCIRQSCDLPLNKWKIETQKRGSEIWVVSNNESIFVGEGYTAVSEERSLCLANVIVRALNDYERAYDTHDKGSNEHWDGH